MLKKEKGLTAIVSVILSILIILTTALGSPIVVKAVSTNSGQAIVEEAMKYLGKPYKWGADGPNSFDCSGFTSYVYKKVGNIDIGRSTYEQIDSGKEVSQSELQPGDLVFPSNHHVGIYIGNGQMIHAPQANDVIKVSSIWSFWRARRILEENSSVEYLLFDSNFYHDRYLDLRNVFGTDVNQLKNHFYNIGIKEGRAATEVFDINYYFNHNKDLSNTFGKNNYEAAYKQFIACGYKESRDISPVFNMGIYIKNNPDVANVFGTNYEGIMSHFLTNGMKEGRNASQNFDLGMYKFNYEDLRNVFGDNNKAYYDHYLTNGINEGRIANHVVFKTTTADLIFDAKFYADKYPDLKKAFGYNELKLAKHFISNGIKERRSASEVFDVNYYLNNNADLIAAFGKDNYQAAYNHFLSNGYKEFRKLSPVFDMSYYIKNNQGIANEYKDNFNGILNHFLTYGMKEGISGSENFNLNVYKKNNEDLRNVFGDDNKAYYDHYLQNGMAEGRTAK